VARCAEQRASKRANSRRDTADYACGDVTSRKQSIAVPAAPVTQLTNSPMGTEISAAGGKSMPTPSPTAQAAKEAVPK